ncbi:hypothetical protein Pmani_003669 [Petrolisthes manimaculis]|uniref:HTH CENPB-type domain-containing protein n=1 Tax=Petrolisthes manimaculis TaxID=1843537 RepID=A0AAE1QFG6_9EUCA|nr:hypothetical protein Pmani_003669 [Petrolisthes manimaculis]
MTRRLAYEYGIVNKVNILDPWKRDKSAGKDWLTGFLERHSELSLRTSEATSLARMTSFNITNLGVFQKKLEEVLLRYQLTESCSGCTNVQKIPKGLNAWMLQHPGQCATIYDMAPLKSSAWDRAATPVNVKAGFRSTGIHPFDIGVFSEEDFGGAFVTDRPMANSSQQSTSHEPDHARQQVQATSPDYEHPSESQSAMVPGIAMGVSPEVSMSTSTSEQPRRVSVEEIRPFPKAAAKKGNSRGRRGKCMIATNTPEKLK